jgi:hypothetical protein
MGKEKLDWFRYQQDRMGEGWCMIDEYYHKCPLCNGKLFSVEMQGMCIMDGNTVIHCEDNEHTFFRSAWDMEEVLYRNEDASETSFDYDKKYKFVESNWVIIN